MTNTNKILSFSISFSYGYHWGHTYGVPFGGVLILLLQSFSHYVATNSIDNYAQHHYLTPSLNPLNSIINHKQVFISLLYNSPIETKALQNNVHS